MSFPRAKITRFNDTKTLTPSPADYNVKIKKLPLGVAIPKSNRFIDPKSPANSETESLASAHTAPCFRTPTLPKKKKLFGLTSRKTKNATLFSKSKKLIDENDEDMLDLEVLKEKMVECNNKDMFIKDLTEQIEEMKVQLCNLEQHKDALARERLKFEDLYNELKEEHKVSMESAFLEYDQETHNLKGQIKILENELFNEQLLVGKLREELKTKGAELKEQIACNATLNENITLIEDLLGTKKNLIENSQSEVENINLKLKVTEEIHQKTLEKLKKKHNDEVVELEYTMLKTVNEIQAALDKEISSSEKKLTTLKNEFLAERESVYEECNARIKQIEEDCKETNQLAEMQMQEKYKDLEITWKMKLEEQERRSNEILKECQQISEYSITQCEWEKNKLREDLEKKVRELGDYQKENADLNIGLNEMRMQFDDLRKDMAKVKEIHGRECLKFQNEITQLLHQRRLYEMTIKNTHDTIETLKKRLLASDHDVEQLTKELDACELSKLEYEGRCNQLRDELKLVGDQNKDLEARYGKIVNEVNTLEGNLLRKLEDYKTEALKNENALKEKLRQKEKDLKEVMESYRKEHLVSEKASALIEMAEQEIHDTSFENEQLKLKLTDAMDNFDESELRLKDSEAILTCLQVENRSLRERLEQKDSGLAMRAEDLDKQLQQVQEKCDSYSKYCDYYKIKAAEYEMELEDLENVNKKYIEKSGKYDELLQMYEALESKYIELEKRTTDQESFIKCINEEANDAEQPMKNNQMVHWKKKNYDLQQTKKDLEGKVKHQGKVIEKLTKQLAQMQVQSPRKAKIQNVDKENIQSPNRTLNNSAMESPGPLRERN